MSLNNPFLDDLYSKVRDDTLKYKEAFRKSISETEFDSEEEIEAERKRLEKKIKDICINIQQYSDSPYELYGQLRALEGEYINKEEYDTELEKQVFEAINRHIRKEAKKVKWMLIEMNKQ